MASRAQVTRRSLLAGGLAAVVAGVVVGADAFAPDDQQAPSAPAGSADVATTQARRARTSLVMVGDSITAGSTTPLKAAFSAVGFTGVTIEAQPSRRIEVGGGPNEPRSGMQAITTLLADHAAPDVWVVALGTNDVGKYADEAAYAQLIDRLLALVPGGRPLLWVDVYRREYLAHCKLFNTALRDRLHARGNAASVSWFDLASQRNQKILKTDDIHPNAKGIQVFADLVATGVTKLP